TGRRRRLFVADIVITSGDDQLQAALRQALEAAGHQALEAPGRGGPGAGGCHGTAEVRAAEPTERQARTEPQLAESEARLAAVIDSVKDAVLIAEANQRISLFNRAAEAMFRCPAAQALGQPVSRFIPREYQADPTEGEGESEQMLESFTHRVRFG